jgi:uncharacterized protein GlcG (DUF336 family)
MPSDQNAPSTTFQNRKFHHIFDLATAVLRRCEELNADAAITAVDSAGRVVVQLRTDHTPWIALEPSRRKASTSAGMKVPSAALAGMAGQDPVLKSILDSMGDALPAPGGFPIHLDGECIGGIGIAAGHYSQDQAIGEHVMFAGDRAG